MQNSGLQPLKMAGFPGAQQTSPHSEQWRCLITEEAMEPNFNSSKSHASVLVLEEKGTKIKPPNFRGRKPTD